MSAADHPTAPVPGTTTIRLDRYCEHCGYTTNAEACMSCGRPTKQLHAAAQGRSDLFVCAHGSMAPFPCTGGDSKPLQPAPVSPSSEPTRRPDVLAEEARCESCGRGIASPTTGRIAGDCAFCGGRMVATKGAWSMTGDGFYRPVSPADPTRDTTRVPPAGGEATPHLCFKHDHATGKQTFDVQHSATPAAEPPAGATDGEGESDEAAIEETLAWMADAERMVERAGDPSGAAQWQRRAQALRSLRSALAFTEQEGTRRIRNAERAAMDWMEKASTAERRLSESETARVAAEAERDTLQRYQRLQSEEGTITAIKDIAQQLADSRRQLQAVQQEVETMPGCRIVDDPLGRTWVPRDSVLAAIARAVHPQEGASR